MKSTFLCPLSLGLVALALGCSGDDGDEAPATSNVETSDLAASNMGGAGAETTSGLRPALPVVENPDHEQLLSAATPELARNKRLVYDFWRTLIEARDTEAAEQYLAEDYIQHDPSADTGRAAVLAFFAAFGERLPVQERVQAKLVAMVAERDFVVFARVDEYAEPRPYTTTWIDLFRIENGVLAEHWDHGRLAMGETPRAYVPPTENPNQSAALASSDPQLAANKQLVHEMWRTLLDAGQGEEAPRFLAPGYIQHNPLASTGLEGFLAFARQVSQPPLEVQPGVANFIQIVAEGDLVSLATLVTYVGANGTPYATTWFDLFRVDGGLLVEHWDTATID
jgi:predicted SnoaL-like aldol condensation-catalyzing enzyme